MQATIHWSNCHSVSGGWSCDDIPEGEAWQKLCQNKDYSATKIPAGLLSLVTLWQIAVCLQFLSHVLSPYFFERLHRSTVMCLNEDIVSA